MTENSKIFLTKNAIYNLLSQQQFSIGLSLYIIKDIEQQLEKGYNDILNKQLKEQTGQQQKEKESFNNGAHPIQWIPQQEEEKEENKDQAN